MANSLEGTATGGSQDHSPADTRIAEEVEALLARATHPQLRGAIGQIRGFLYPAAFAHDEDAEEPIGQRSPGDDAVAKADREDAEEAEALQDMQELSRDPDASPAVRERAAKTALELGRARLAKHSAGAAEWENAQRAAGRVV